MSLIVLACSLGLQLVAAVLAVRLIRLTRSRLAWSLIAVAAVLMGARRLITLVSATRGGSYPEPDLNAELVALLISILMVVGLSLLAPVFRALERSREALRRAEQKYRELVDLLPQPVLETDRDGILTFANRTIHETLGYEPRILENGSFRLEDLSPPEDGDRIRAMLEAGRRGEVLEPQPLRALRKDGTTFPILAFLSVIFADGKPVGLRGVGVDVTDRERAHEAIQARTRQQAAVANLGQLALTGTDPATLFREATSRVASILEADLCEILELSSDLGGLLLRAGAGCTRDRIGSFVDPDGSRSVAAVALRSVSPVVVRNLTAEQRFRDDRLLEDEGVRSGASVPIRVAGRSWGALGAYTRTLKPFTDDDVLFLQAIANVLAAAVERSRAEASIRHRLDIESVLASISRRFLDVGPAEVDDQIHRALRAIGESTGVDRCYVFQFSEDGARLNSTHEWCAEGISSHVAELQDVPADRFAWSVDRLRRMEVVHASDVEDLPPEAEAERSEFRRRGIRSIVRVPMAVRGRVLGSVGFDAVRQYTTWSDADIQILRIVAEIFALALERRRSERVLRESEVRFRSAFDHAPIGMALVAPDERFLQVNQALCDILGRSRRELLSLRVPDVTHPDDRALEAGYKRRASQGTAEDFHIVKRYLHADGHTVWGQLSVSVIRDDDGNPIYFIGQLEDITERRRLQDQLLRSQKMEAIGRLAGGIAHDFNNLLTAINGYGSMLLDRMGSGDPYRREVEEILRAGERAALLTGQLLAFSRRQVQQLHVIDLNLVLLEMESMLRHLIGENVRLAADLQDEAWAVRADPGQVDQLVLNLALNARDAMAEGGTMTLVTRNVAIDPFGASGDDGPPPGEYLMLEVSDTGMGMTEEVRAHVFEPFFTTKEPGRGTGLGLATVYGIVHQTGGHISVESSPGAGSTFRVYFPRTVESEPEAEPGPPVPEAPETATETILLAEDEDLVREVSRDVLEAAGYRVLAADSAERALEIEAEHPGPIDLLLSDVVMPGMSGTSLAERLVEKRPGTAVLLMSGYAAEALAPHGVLDRGQPFIAKPWSPHALVEKIRDVLRAARASANPFPPAGSDSRRGRALRED